MKVTVTQEHIDKAIEFRRANKPIDLSHNCPIYWAVKEKGFNAVTVQKTKLFVDDRRFNLSKRAREFISLFDGTHYEDLKPFSFFAK